MEEVNVEELKDRLSKLEALTADQTLRMQELKALAADQALRMQGLEAAFERPVSRDIEAARQRYAARKENFLESVGLAEPKI